MTNATNPAPVPTLTLSPTQQAALSKALALLRASGCKYKVLTPDGAEFGELKLAPPEPPVAPRKRRPSTHPHGALKNYYWPMVKHMKPGEVVCIPPADFDPVRLRSAITADLSAEWGKGTFITTVTKGDNANVEILRVE